MKRWLHRIVVILVAASAGLYVGDWAVYRLRGSPQSQVTVDRYLTIPLKGNKSEYDYLGSTDVGCSVSLFPQDGESACWQLRRHPTENTKM
jgi:hypothetical protein